MASTRFLLDSRPALTIARGAGLPSDEAMNSVPRSILVAPRQSLPQLTRSFETTCARRRAWARGLGWLNRNAAENRIKLSPQLGIIVGITLQFGDDQSAITDLVARVYPAPIPLLHGRLSLAFEVSIHCWMRLARSILTLYCAPKFVEWIEFNGPNFNV